MVKNINKYKCSKEEYNKAIVCMRGTPLGNQFIIGTNVETREEAVEKYKAYFLEQVLKRDPEIINALSQIQPDSLLMCCCKPKACHTDIIVEVMNTIYNYSDDFNQGLNEYINSIKSNIVIVNESLFFNKKVDALVNTVNCVGVMGTGVAAEFKPRYMENFIHYEDICKKKILQPGKAFLSFVNNQSGPKLIINLATKDHYKNDSSLDIIKECINTLYNICLNYSIKVINMPKIGCGNGNLNWNDVYPLLKERFKNTDVLIRVCTNNERSSDYVLKDGLTHINIGFKAKTELGRQLSNLYRSPFHISEFNSDFQSIEALWYWLKTGCKHDYLKSLWGFSAKEQGKKHPTVARDDFYTIIKKALRAKITQNTHIRNNLYFSKLPFDHYYSYGNDSNAVIRIPPSSTWLSEEWEQIRNEEKVKGFKLIIAGTRSYHNYDVVLKAFNELPFKPTDIVSGHARGVDALGETLSLNELNKKAILFPADWNKFGDSAGGIRNEEMAIYAHGLLAIWKDNSSGTRDMIEKAKKHNLFIKVIKV